MKIILELLIRFYVNRYCNNDITKLSDEEELKAYMFMTSGDVIKVLKNNITTQTLRHFDAKTEQERWMIKGAALALQVIKDRHYYAIILKDVKDLTKQVKMWREFRLKK